MCVNVLSNRVHCDEEARRNQLRKPLSCKKEKTMFMQFLRNIHKICCEGNLNVKPNSSHLAFSILPRVGLPQKKTVIWEASCQFVQEFSILSNRREAIMWTEVEIGCIVKAKLTDFATENSYLSNLLLSYLCKHL